MTLDSAVSVGHTAADIPAVVAGLRKTFATGRTRDLQWRQRQLLALAQAMEENETAIAKALEASGLEPGALVLEVPWRLQQMSLGLRHRDDEPSPA